LRSPYDGGWRIIDVWESRELLSSSRRSGSALRWGRATSGMSSSPPLPPETRAVIADAAASRLGQVFSTSV